MDPRLTMIFNLILGAQFFIQSNALYQQQYGVYHHFIVVSGSRGNDTDSCLNAISPEASIRNPCKTLDHAVGPKRNATQILLEPGMYNLSTNATFENVFDFELSGNRSVSTSVMIQCSTNMSLTFIRSGDIKILGITFHRCGSLHASTVGSAFKKVHKEHVPFYAGIFLAYVKNVTMKDCTITESPGIGLILYDVGGEVHIKRSIFSRNSPDPDNICSRNLTYTRAGGGIYVEFTFEGALPPFDKNNPERFKYQNNNNYMIERCTFEENYAPEQCFMNYIEYPNGNDHMPFGRGGGLSFFIKGNATNNRITIHNCSFLRNDAIWGAGMFVEIQDQTQNNTILLRKSVFKDNYCHTGGGGVRSGVLTWIGTFYANNIIHEDCIFYGNFAVQGGGVSHYGPFYHPVNADDSYRRIIYLRCQWINNKATVGSAIGLVKSADMTLSVDNMNPNPKANILPYIVELEDCTVTGNRIVKTEDRIVIGQGALHTYKFPLIFRGNTTFTNNSNTALVLDNTVLKVFGTTTFASNNGLEGGAIGMYGASLLNLMPASEMYFKSNRAAEKGGAIYVDVGGPPVVGFNTTELNTRACFIAYNDTVTVPAVFDWDTNITFVSNDAPKGGGKSIYATSLQACRATAQKRSDVLNWGFIKYIKEDGSPVDTGQDQISTDPIRIEIIEKEWNRSPGEEFAASIKLYDEKNSLVQGVVKLSIEASNPSDARLGTSSPLLLIKNIRQNDTEVSGLMLQGRCRRKFNLTLRTVSGQTISKTNNETLRLSDCHQGYHINKKTGECVCSKNQFIGISSCSDNKKDMYLKTGYWAGKVDGKFDTYSCPQGYCKETTATERDFIFQKNQLCAKNRNDSIPLCGECQSNYTVSIGSEDCVESKTCNWERLWLLLVFFLIMLIVVLLVLKIDLDIFTAYLNAWLYSYQIIEYLVKENTQFDPVMSVVIGLANWKIKGVGFCFVPGLTNFYKLGVHYILPFYVLFLLFVLSKIARCFPRCYINKNVSHALCNLLVLCYTDITIISFSILHYVKVGDKWVLYSDGKISFYDDWRTHLPFTILAIIMLMFVALLPIALLCTPWFFRKFPFLNRYRLFFDLFQNCFEDQEKQRDYRWFAAFYFMCRIWILLMALYLPLGPLKRSVLEASCMVVLGIFLYLQPYNTRYSWLNTLDAIFLTNLCLITVFSSALTSDAAGSTFNGLKVLVKVLAYVPLLYVVILGLVCGFAYFKDDMNAERNSSSLLNDNTEQEGTSADSTAARHSTTIALPV